MYGKGSDKHFIVECKQFVVDCKQFVSRWQAVFVELGKGIAGICMGGVQISS